MVKKLFILFLVITNFDIFGMLGSFKHFLGSPRTLAERLEKELREAVIFEDIQEIENLLKRTNEFDINAQDETGSTALHFASDMGYENIIDLLLDYGACPDIKDNDGETARNNTTFNWKELVAKSKLRQLEKIKELEALKQAPKDQLVKQLKENYADLKHVDRTIESYKGLNNHKNFSLELLLTAQKELTEKEKLIKQHLSPGQIYRAKAEVQGKIE